ncbi:hypothetical protein GCM10027174_43750 [Salinifilum aidingensis]
MDADLFDDVLSTVRDSARGEVVAAEDEIAENDAVPQRLRDTAADVGLSGFALPEGCGGLGLSMSEDVRLAVEPGYTTPALRSMFGTNNARTDEEAERHGGIPVFLLETDRTGVRIGAPDATMGQAGAHTAEVVLDEASPSSSCAGPPRDAANEGRGTP